MKGAYVYTESNTIHPKVAQPDGSLSHGEGLMRKEEQKIQGRIWQKGDVP